jgi:hypothetical protein
MSMIALVLVIVAVIAIASVGMLLIVIAGIHGDEGHMSLADRPRTRTRALARWVLGAYALPIRRSARPHTSARR